MSVAVAASGRSHYMTACFIIENENIGIHHILARLHDYNNGKRTRAMKTTSNGQNKTKVTIEAISAVLRVFHFYGGV